MGQMARPLSHDLRIRIVKAVDAGSTYQEVATRFAVSVSCVSKIVRRWRRTGSLEPGQMGGWKEHALAMHEEVIRKIIAARSDITLDELRAALAQTSIHVGRSTIWRFLQLHRMKRKKSGERAQAPTE